MIQAVGLGGARKHLGGGEPRKSLGPILEHALRDATVEFKNEGELEFGTCFLEQCEGFLRLLARDMDPGKIVIKGFEFGIQLERGLVMLCGLVIILRFVGDAAQVGGRVGMCPGLGGLATTRRTLGGIAGLRSGLG